MIKLIIDTDIGNDIDDAMALSFALNHSEIDLLAITTTSGEAWYRKRIAEEFVALSSSHVPVYEGLSCPLLGKKLQPETFQRLKTVKKDSIVSENPFAAVQAIADLVERYPDQIVLCAIGPFSNVALFIQSYPKLVPKLKKVIVMGYKVSQDIDDMHKLDWNVMCDEVAAQSLVQADFKELVIVPCDVTYDIHSDKTVLGEKLHGVHHQLIKELAAYWFEKYDGFSYHDPITLLYLVKPELFDVEHGTLVYNSSNSPLLTQYDWLESTKKSSHTLVTKLNKEEVLKALYETLNK
ncbi:nucleoside hydrolase [Erysipelothrix urinaevulpis]|uniref:nucleoside hydrolase n=1 Tax=Erysipelothrix urinaevulpis TaxID=2683717 RepID=UPI00135B14C0|nr:nucleoside hydrolase [Erysipelothrix urinaevulpis]